MNKSIKKQLKDFSRQWENRGYEKGETQPFWLELLGILLGRDATDFIRFEEQVHLDNTSFMDGNTKELDTFSKRSSFEHFRREIRNPEIITYDELYERARFIVTSQHEGNNEFEEDVPF